MLTFITLSLLSKLREVDGVFVTHDCGLSESGKDLLASDIWPCSASNLQGAVSGGRKEKQVEQDKTFLPDSPAESCSCDLPATRSALIYQQLILNGFQSSFVRAADALALMIEVGMCPSVNWRGSRKSLTERSRGENHPTSSLQRRS